MALHVYWDTIKKDIVQEVQGMQRPLSFLMDFAKKKPYRSTWDVVVACICGTLVYHRVHTIWENGKIVSYHSESERFYCEQCQANRSTAHLDYGGSVRHVESKEA